MHVALRTSVAVLEITPAGKPPVLVNMTVYLLDGAPKPCTVRIAATPTA